MRTKASGRAERLSGPSARVRTAAASGRKKAGASGRKASDSQRFAAWVVRRGLASKEQVQEAARIVALRRDIGEVTTLDRILFERDVLSAGDVYRAQEALQLRLVVCDCGERINAFQKKAGSRLTCPKCQAKLRVPGVDPGDPFAVASAAPAGPSAEPLFLGLLGVAAALGLLVGGAVEAWATHLRLPALGAASGVGVAAILLGRRRRLVTAAGIGLATFTGLVLATALGNAPGSGAYGVLGVDAHRLVAPLALGHLVLLVLLAGPLLTRAHPLVLLGGLLPGLYGLAFLVHGSATGSADPFGGPALLERVPWWGHPGAVTLLGLFPLAALALVSAGLLRVARGRPRTLVRDAGLAAGLLLLAGYGLALGSLRGVLPAPGLRAQVEATLAGRVDASWRPTPGEAAAPGRGTTAVAATADR